VLLNLVQKLPFPTKLPVLCPWVFNRSIGETLRREKTRWKKPRICDMTIMVPCNVAAPLASDHSFRIRLNFSCTRLVRKIKFQIFTTFSNKYNFSLMQASRTYLQSIFKKKKLFSSKFPEPTVNGSTFAGDRDRIGSSRGVIQQQVLYV
jgi:hypothetical protein